MWDFATLNATQYLPAKDSQSSRYQSQSGSAKNIKRQTFNRAPIS